MNLNFIEVLTLIFVVCKLTGYIDHWSWFMVMSPYIVWCVLIILLIKFPLFPRSE